MRTNPDLLEVIRGDRGMLRGIDVCCNAECLVSAMTLLYAAIDAISALTRPTTVADTSRRFFIDWVDDYLVPTGKLKCSSTDLYAARCGVVHTYRADPISRGKGRPSR